MNSSVISRNVVKLDVERRRKVTLNKHKTDIIRLMLMDMIQLQNAGHAVDMNANATSFVK